MDLMTIALFLIYCFGLGFTATSFLKNSSNFLERNLMRIGFGLSLLPFLGLVLNLFGLPADWRIILIVSLAYPVYYSTRNFSKFDISKLIKLKITKTNLSIFVMLLIFAGTFYIYGTGAFKYPYLEDDDSWSHAIGVKYVSVEKTAFTVNPAYFHYMDPYPPTYDLLFGIMSQTNDSIYWTLKFFNALIISLSIIFFYFFVKEFIGNRNKALFATFALASIPCFLSHFIWSIALAVPLYFVSFYAVERIKHDNRWWILAGLVMVTTLTSSPTHSTYFGLFFVLYFITRMILERKILIYPALAGLSGLSLSFLFWWLPNILKYGLDGTLSGIGLGGGNTVFNVLGTADRVYTFSDFVFAKTANMINNPIGVGLILSFLLVIGVIAVFIKFRYLFKQENHWLVLSFVWFLFTFYAVNASNMPVKLSPFRAWMLLAIPVCILATEGAFVLMDSSKKLGFGKIIVLFLIIVGVLFTSTYQKYTVNTAVWPPGGFWGSMEEIQGYSWLRENIPPDTKVFSFVNNGPVIGMDMYTCHWCEDVRSFQKTGINESASDINTFLKSKHYEYVIIGGQFARKYGVNEANDKLNELLSSGLFQPTYNVAGFILLQVV